MFLAREQDIDPGAYLSMFFPPALFYSQSENRKSLQVTLRVPLLDRDMHIFFFFSLPRIGVMHSWFLNFFSNPVADFAILQPK